jgi:hypothetical protein
MRILVLIERLSNAGVRQESPDQPLSLESVQVVAHRELRGFQVAKAIPHLVGPFYPGLASEMV